MAEVKVIDESHKISDKRGNGKLRREIWINTATGKVTRYNLAYINHSVHAGDNGRVVGYDNAHDGHHRHDFGMVEPIEFVSFEDIEERFEQDWTALKDRKMTKLTLKTGTETNFFVRGRRLAEVADRGEQLPTERIISFEDPAEMMKLVTTARLALFRAVKEMPGSITDIAQRLHRDRSAVKRDVDELARAGLVTIADKVLPGHGRMKEVRATANQFSLQADVL